MALHRNIPDSHGQPLVDFISDARIVTAEDQELRVMQAEVARLNAMIEAQLQKALGRQSEYEQLLGNHQDSSAIPAANINIPEDRQASPQSGGEASVAEPVIDTFAGLPSSIVKAEQSPESHIALDSALTPVSDLVKDGDVLSPSVAKSGVSLNSSGIETPETNVPDQQTSPAEAGDILLE